jgi:hypothetical protein
MSRARTYTKPEIADAAAAMYVLRVVMQLHDELQSEPQTIFAPPCAY